LEKAPWHQKGKCTFYPYQFIIFFSTEEWRIGKQHPAGAIVRNKGTVTGLSPLTIICRKKLADIIFCVAFYKRIVYIKPYTASNRRGAKGVTHETSFI
jgi:hypothetical protein